MSDKMMELAAAADAAGRVTLRMIHLWQGSAAACSRIRAAAPPGILPGWLREELGKVSDDAWEAYESAQAANEDALGAYAAACLEDQAARDAAAAAVRA